MKSKKINVKSNFTFNALYQMTGIFIPLVTIPYLTRVLHAEGLGIYSFAYSVAYYFYIFIRLGLHNYGNRTIAYIKDDEAALSKTFYEIYTSQFFIGVIFSVVYIIYCFLWAPDKLLAFIFLFQVISGTFDLTWFLYGLEEFKIAAVRDILTKIITALCIFVFVRSADDVWKYALIYSMGFFIGQIIVIPVVIRNVHFELPSKAGVFSHIVPNLILFLPTIAVSLYKSMDKIMIGVMSSDAELGYYHSCENIIKVPLALITALGTVMLPRMSNMISAGDKTSDIERTFDKSIMFAMFISSSICMGIMTVAQEFVPIYYGSGFDKCISLFYIILPSCLFLAFANVIRTQYLLPRKKDRLFIISLFSGAGVNVLLNLVLIPRFASVGAAIGTLAAEVVVCVIQSAAVFKEANIGRNIISSIPFVASGVLMFLIFRNYTPNISNAIIALLVKIIICGAFYLTVLGIIIFAKKRICCRSN